MEEKADIKSKKILPVDVFKFYKDVIETWEPSSEAWSFNYGDDLTTGAGFLSSMYIMHNFRKQLKIRQYSKLTCYTPVVGLACLGSYIASAYITTSLILEKDSCPLCISTNSSLLQLAMGFGYPLLMTPVVTFYIADRLLTYPVPSIVKAPKEVFNLWLKLIQKNPRPLLIAAIGQVLIAGFVSQQKNVFCV